MKRINDYRKLLGVTKTTELKELKTIYRNAMKDSHPDRFFDNQELKQEAEERSKQIIEAYHFLVSIAPETLEQTRAEYVQTTSTSSISDYSYEKQVLKVTFTDGNVYEYFGVPHGTYSKMVNSDSPARFARRHVYPAFQYRSLSKLVSA